MGRRAKRRLRPRLRRSQRLLPRAVWLIQNSRITLNGDNGRRICYQLSALKGNTLDVSLGYGIASTKEVSGNTIRGRIRHKVFQDCSGVENNKVEVRRFSILG